MGSSDTVTLDGRFMSAMPSAGIAPGDVVGPTQRPRDGEFSDTAPARSGSVWRDFASGRTAPGAQRGAASPTHPRSLAGGEGRYSSGGVRQIYLSCLRVASPRTGRHGRAARPFAGGTPTFSDFPSRPPLTTHTPSLPLPHPGCPSRPVRQAVREAQNRRARGGERGARDSTRR